MIDRQETKNECRKNSTKDKKPIVTYVQNTGVKQVLLIFDEENIGKVIDGFIDVLETHGLHDNKGVYKAIGAVKKETTKGLKIGSYWSEFDGTTKKQNLERILPYYEVGKIGSTRLCDKSRKLAYVGMSRPKKLLCVAMQAKTYDKSNGVFDDDWEIIDLRC